MRMGALLGALPDPSNPRAIAEQVRARVGEGYTSLWVPQAIGRGFMLSDPLMVLTVAATTTEDIELGTAVLQVPLYHPMDLAHRILTLRQICGDRLVVGVGPGSTERDFEAFDRDYESRFAVFSRSIDELRGVLRDGKLNQPNLSPWPNVSGSQRIFLGTWGKGVKRAAGEFDGWIASAANRTVEETEEAALRYDAAGGGRSLVSTIWVDRSTDLGLLKENLGRFAAAGFDDAVVMILPGGPGPGEVRKLAG